MAVNTVADWTLIGETEPWFGVLSAPQFLRANINDAAKEHFYALGEQEVERVVDVLRNSFGPFEPKLGLDFGSGLGRLSFPMSRICERVIGIDISDGMIAEAERQRIAKNINNVQFVKQIPDDIKVDWLHSHIVFQHILPRDGYNILQNLLDKLSDRSFISLHLTYAHDKRDPSTLIRDLDAYRFDGDTLTILGENTRDPGTMSMYSYDMNRILLTLTRARLGNLFLQPTDHGGNYGFWIFARRG
jgi:SAM-dependent methyltransferase